MSLNPELSSEIHLLTLFNLDTTQQGIKLHKSADLDLLAAADRLYRKGLIDQPDGGYLTALGRDAAEHLDLLLGVMTAGEAKGKGA